MWDIYGYYVYCHPHISWIDNMCWINVLIILWKVEIRGKNCESGNKGVKNFGKWKLGDSDCSGGSKGGGGQGGGGGLWVKNIVF